MRRRWKGVKGIARASTPVCKRVFFPEMAKF
jgi:hypothetical protein